MAAIVEKSRRRLAFAAKAINLKKRLNVHIKAISISGRTRHDQVRASCCSVECDHVAGRAGANRRGLEERRQHTGRRARLWHGLSGPTLQLADSDQQAECRKA